MTPGAPAKRPTFLTVLCILTFIGCGIAIVMNILGYLALSAMSTVVDSTTEIAGSSAVADYADKLIQWGAIYYIVGIVAAIICFIGALMMWKLKKTGFYIYIIGEIAPPIAAFALLGGFGALGTMALVSALIVPIAFIIMYGLNLKHMS